MSYAGSIGAIASDTMAHYMPPVDMKVYGASCYSGTKGTTNSTTFGLNYRGTSIIDCSLGSNATSSVDANLNTSGQTVSSSAALAVDINAVQTTPATDGYLTVYWSPWFDFTLP